MVYGLGITLTLSIHVTAEPGVDYGAWDGLLKQYVNSAGQVDYAKLQQARA